MKKALMYTLTATLLMALLTACGKQADDKQANSSDVTIEYSEVNSAKENEPTEEDYTQYYEEIYVTGQTIGKGLSESAKFEAEKGTAQDYVTAGQIPSVEAYSEWRLAEHPLPTGQEEYDGNVFIKPTEPENGQPTETPEQHIEQKPAEQKPSTGSNTSSGNQTPAQPSTPAPVEKPSSSNAEGIENGMITIGGLNRPAPVGGEITDESIRQGLADGTAGTISDADLEESASHWAD